MTKYTANFQNDKAFTIKLVNWFKEYVAELTHIANCHTISSDAMDRLKEQELILGTIMSPSSQPRHRKEKVARLKLNMRNLVKLTSLHFGQLKADMTKEELQSGLGMAWEGWKFSITQADTFGGSSFGLISLGYVLRALKLLSAREETFGIIEPEMYNNGIVVLGAEESWD